MGVVKELHTLVFASTTSDGAYQCQRCRTQFDAQYHVCPECGGYRVDRIKWQISD